MAYVKSGEIFRVGSGHYCFLCIHCGFNFDDIAEMLHHIDSHFDEIDNANASIEDTKDPRITSVFTQIPQLSEMDNELAASEWPEIEIKIEDDQKGEDAGESRSVDHEKPNKASRGQSIRRRRKPAKSVKQESGENSVAEPKQCPVCELICDNDVSYKNHLKAIHHMRGDVYQCYICGLYCKHLTALKRHFSSTTFHSTKFPKCYQCGSAPPITDESAYRDHKCFLCKQWYPNHLQFRLHFKNDHSQDVDTFFSKKENCNEFTCYICRKDFARKYYLRCHMIIHNENKKFVCHVCGNRYRTNTILRRHSNVHEGKTYKCDDCGKTFGYYARLRIHRYSHRTELNYKCTVCSKAFKVQKYLARHMLIHREEKKFACRYCGKRFTFSTGRRTHEVAQHNAV